MEFPLILQLLFIRLHIVLVYVWTLFYFWIPIDQLLQIEEGGHPPAARNVTFNIVANKRASDKGDQRPTKAGTEKTVVTDSANDLIHPEQCSGEDEGDSMDEGSSTQCSQNDNQDSQLVVTIPTLVQQFHTHWCPWVVSDNKQQQVSPPVAASKQLTPQVPPTTVREPEVAPPDTKTIDYNLSSIKEAQNTYNSRYQDGRDDDDSEEDEEDEEEEKKTAASHESCSCDFEKKEEFILQGTQRCTSDTKLDQAGKEKEIVYIMTDDGRFTSQVATMEGNQTRVNEEVNNNAGPVSTEPSTGPSTMLSTPASNGLVDTVNQTDQQTQEESSNGDNETLPDNLSDHTSPND